MSPGGLSKIAERGINQVVSEARFKSEVEKLVSSSNLSITVSMPKLALGLPHRILNFKEDFVDTEVSLKNMRLNDLAFKKIEVHCEQLRCKVKVPIDKLDVTGDFRIRCLTGECGGQDVVEIKRLSLSLSPVIEYDVLLHPGKPSNEFLELDPKSARIQLPLSSMGLHLDLNEAEQKELEEVYQRRVAEGRADRDRELSAAQCDSPKNSISPQADSLETLISEVEVQALMDSIRPYIKDSLSLNYLLLAKMGLRIGSTLDADYKKEKKTSEQPLSRLMSDLLSENLGPAIAEEANLALREAPVLQKNLSVDVPVMTPSKLLKQPNLNKSEPQSLDHVLSVKGTDTDEMQGHLIVKVGGCPEQTQESSPLLSSDLAGQDFDAAGSVSIGEMNEYLKKVFSDPKQNSVYFENLEKESLAGKVGLDRKVRIRFNTPPQIVTEWNPSKKEHELLIVFDVNEKRYRFPFMKNMSIFESKLHGKAKMDYSEDDERLKLNISNTQLAFNDDNPVTAIGETVKVMTGYFFAKAALINELVIPKINSSLDFKKPEFEGLRLKRLHTSSDGKSIIFTTLLNPSETTPGKE